MSSFWASVVTIIGGASALVTLLVGLHAVRRTWRLRDDISKDISIRAGLPQSGATQSELDRLILERGKRLVIAEHRRVARRRADKWFEIATIICLSPSILRFIDSFLVGWHYGSDYEGYWNQSSEAASIYDLAGPGIWLALLVAALYLTWLWPRERQFAALKRRLRAEQVGEQ